MCFDGIQKWDTYTTNLWVSLKRLAASTILWFRSMAQPLCIKHRVASRYKMLCGNPESWKLNSVWWIIIQLGNLCQHKVQVGLKFKILIRQHLPKISWKWDSNWARMKVYKVFNIKMEICKTVSKWHKLSDK